MIGCNKGIKMRSTDGKTIVTIIGNVNGIKLGLDV